MRYTSTGDELTGKQMTDQWYEEANNYNYNQDFQQGKGHFAQIVWVINIELLLSIAVLNRIIISKYVKNTTKEVGFGRAKSRDNKWYAVANYYPAGN